MAWVNQALMLAGLAPAGELPRDVWRDIQLALPISLTTLSDLTTRAVTTWLDARGVRVDLRHPDRPLHGCLVARAGSGVIFVNSSDSTDEQRFTVAHEAGHFIAEHLLPRAEALRAFGEEIRPVLDGLRPATGQEALRSVVTRVPIGTQTHLMARGPSGHIESWSIEKSEQRADRLALEIIAPRRALLAILGSAYGDRNWEEPEAAALVARSLGLPIQVALASVSALNKARRPPPDLISRVFGIAEDT